MLARTDRDGERGFEARATALPVSRTDRGPAIGRERKRKLGVRPRRRTHRFRAKIAIAGSQRSQTRLVSRQLHGFHGVPPIGCVQMHDAFREAAEIFPS
jgi:hypothetical protein